MSSFRQRPCPPFRHALQSCLNASEARTGMSLANTAGPLVVGWFTSQYHRVAIPFNALNPARLVARDWFSTAKTSRRLNGGDPGIESAQS